MERRLQFRADVNTPLSSRFFALFASVLFLVFAPRAIAQERALERYYLSGNIGVSTIPNTIQTLTPNQTPTRAAVGSGTGFELRSGRFWNPAWGSGLFLSGAHLGRGIVLRAGGAEFPLRLWPRLPRLQVGPQGGAGGFIVTGYSGKMGPALGAHASYELLRGDRYGFFSAAFDLSWLQLRIPNPATGQRKDFTMIQPSLSLQFRL